MKRLFRIIFITCAVSLVAGACKKNLQQVVMTDGTAPVVTLSPSSVTLSSAAAADTVQVIAWSAPEYGFSAAVNYTLEIAAGGTNFSSPQRINTGAGRRHSYVGAVLNDLAIGMGIEPGNSGTLDIRVRSSLSDSLVLYSDAVSLDVTTYAVEFPALLVKGGNGWVTPSTRTNGFLLASPGFNTSYEGYLYLPNADGWGGDAFTLISTSSGSEYGWGSSNTTMSIGGGNLWLTPAPNYMKVNADINALTINFTPVEFFISGDHNGWSTSATPMTYDQNTRQLVAHNVSFTAGNSFVFTCNGGYDISYKVDDGGKMIFAGPPDWAGSNIRVEESGTYTVTLDLSGGNGSYTYKLE